MIISDYYMQESVFLIVLIVAERFNKQTIDQMVDQIMSSAGRNEAPAACSGSQRT